MTEIETEPTSEEADALEKRKLSERAALHVAELWLQMEATDAWQQLALVLRSQAARQKASIVASLGLRDIDAPGQGDAGALVNQRDIDFARGVIEGISRPFQALETARKTIEKRDKPAAQAEPEPEGDVWA